MLSDGRRNNAASAWWLLALLVCTLVAWAALAALGYVIWIWVT